MIFVNKAQAEPDHAGHRLALVIGNGLYPNVGVNIRSITPDADALAAKLRQFGFATDLGANATKADLDRAVEALYAKVEPGSIVFIDVSGLGLQIGGRDYILAVDAQVWSEDESRRNGLDIDALLDGLSRRGAAVTIVVIDAARHNPYERRFRAVSAGLAEIPAAKGRVAMLSAAPGQLIASEAEASNRFMAELLKQLDAPNAALPQAFTDTQAGVAGASHGQQTPSITNALTEVVPLKGATAQAADPGLAKPAGAPAVPGPDQANVVRDCADCPELTIISSGSFEMGAPGSSLTLPVHHVTIGRRLAMSTDAITFDDWDKCVAGGGCSFRPDDFRWGGGKQPVINLSWTDAKAYVAWLARRTGQAYRLPSEAEWEYAAHAGTTTAFYWGPELKPGLANCRDCQPKKVGRPLPVGSFPPNPFGLRDMSGNVAEWMEDCWNDSYRGAPDDGSAWMSGNCAYHVVRGGAFDTGSIFIMPATRFRYDTDVRYYANGFRVVRNF